MRSPDLVSVAGKQKWYKLCQFKTEKCLQSGKFPGASTRGGGGGGDDSDFLPQSIVISLHRITYFSPEAIREVLAAHQL